MRPNLVKPLSEVRIRMRELRFKVADSETPEKVRLPFGISGDPAHFRFEKHQHGETFEIRAVTKGGGKSDRYTVIFPGYEVSDHIAHPETGKQVALRLWTVYTDRDRLAARQAIQRVHYLTDTGRGMFLACAFVDPKQQVEIRTRARKGNKSSDDISWLIPCGGVIGCGVVDTLWHGNPIAGRALIAEKLNLKGDKWKLWSRDDLIKNMRIAWGSRFAVDLPYQGLGIGVIIAKHLKKVAQRYRIPAADFIEVITTIAKTDQEKSSQGDFLERAGYIRLGADLKSGSLMIMDAASGYRIPAPAVKNYYYADLRKGL